MARSMTEIAGHISPTEAKFEFWRRRLGLVLAPVVFLAIWFLPVTELSEPAHRLLAIVGLVITLWVSEAIPLAVTALLGPALCVVLGVSSEREVFKSFGHPILFLFLGSFLLAEGMLRHGLNRRIAFLILGIGWVSKSPARILAAFGVVTGSVSMWISNTTAAAMMFPIAVAILTEMARRQSELSGREVKFTELKFGTGLMLAAAFAASIGGMATPVGTPPNLIGIGFLERSLGVKITFFQWMQIGLPLAAVLIAFLVFYLNRVCPARSELLGESATWIREQKARLGPLTRGEKNVLGAFSVTVLLWLLPGVVAAVAGVNAPSYQWLNQHLPEGVCALLGAILLFVLPVNWARNEFTLTWQEAKRIDWGTILLFGGGLALGEAMFSTGLAKWLGEGLAGAFQTHTTLGLIVLFSAITTILTETTSNTAVANMLVPVAISVAMAAGVSPVQPAIAVCFAASLAFMLPVSTPPNAVVYGSGCVPLTKMIRHGIVLDAVSMIAVVTTVYWLVPLVIRT
jgi:sodium-dependent dicarboxylate transporter 2/3/5